MTVYGNSQVPENTLIENCWLWDLQMNNSGSFSTLARFGYISGRRQLNTMVRNCSFYVTTATGSAFAVVGVIPSTGTSVSLGSGTPDTWLEFSNNIVYKIASGGPIHSWPSLNSAPTLPTICDSNCYFDMSTDAFASFDLGAGGGTQTAADLTSWQAATGIDLLSFDIDPEFVNAPAGDLHIKATSPCKDGSLLGTTATTDIDGNSRGFGAASDIGADENLSLVPVVPVTSFSIGTGCVGSNGQVPQLVTDNLPQLGNSLFTMRTENLPTGTNVYLYSAFALAGSPLTLAPGCRFYLDLASAFTAIQLGLSPAGPVAADGSGVATFPYPIPPLPGLAGFDLRTQAIALDVGATPPFTTTNALLLELN